MFKFILGGGSQKKTDVGVGVGGGEEEEEGRISCGTVTVDHIDLQNLPEGCIANIHSARDTHDLVRTVSFLFRLFVPFLPSSHSSTSNSNSKSKKELYLTLCDNPVLIEQGKMSFSLDKSSGKKCYMISARALSIVWADTPHYWKWISLPDSRFEEVAELVSVCWLEIRGKIGRRMLSPSTLYKAYLVFKSTAGAYGFVHQPVEVSVGMLGGEEPTRHTVFLDAERGQNAAYHIRPGPRRIGLINRRHFLGYQSSQPREINEAQYPKERDDGWLEIEMGEFFCQGGGDGGDGGDGELEMACLEVTSGHWKGGLIVQGIEIRPKIKD
ncbi:putative F-box protein PP2-B12 [Prunus yedoensis var. nudiflora]|uniref:Putative F-box protein PP2-B12 n=1 Tax=Prunus yedoensis var. nudiflora TaxID=2094558 RepID=A0A314ZMJ5_PRUYE|nr:putative F-box protein PP2-B12 [Prunus yedoensis var. nudiflora]